MVGDGDSVHVHRPSSPGGGTLRLRVYLYGGFNALLGPNQVALTLQPTPYPKSNATHPYPNRQFHSGFCGGKIVFFLLYLLAVVDKTSITDYRVVCGVGLI